MAFYRPNPQMASQLSDLLDQLANKGRPGLHNKIAITWIRYESRNPEICSGIGAGWSEKQLQYPASVVKLVYAVAVEAWLQKDFIPESEELRSALKAMIADSSNDATSLIVDLLTGTTSGPSLSGTRWRAWQKQRLLINEWLHSFNWPELARTNCCQKTWGDGPFGREKDFYGTGNVNRNAMSTSGTGRILEAIMTDGFLSPQACKRLRAILFRSLERKKREENPENQIDGFLGEGLSEETKLWSKAGLMSHARHDAAWCCSTNGNPMLLVVFSQGKELAKDTKLFPSIAIELAKLNEENSSSL